MYIKRLIALAGAVIGIAVEANAQTVDYSIPFVPEESGLDIMKISSDNDYVCMPEVKRSKRLFSWATNRILDVSNDGANIAYLSYRNDATNIFIKELGKQGGSVQRTNRKNVLDFAYSSNGKTICFSENRGATNQIFITDAVSGYVCRQITSANIDSAPKYTSDMKQILFTRMESNSSSIWGYNIESNFVLSYTNGADPCPIGPTTFLCTRKNSENRNEIWKIDYSTGVEECIVADPEHSYASPVVSPDGKWILFVGESVISGEDFIFRNADIYACRLDGTQLTQITYHAADDLSPVWSRDGKYIYFVSQRGSATATANIWRLTFQYY